MCMIRREKQQPLLTKISNPFHESNEAEISEAFLMGLKVSFEGNFCVSSFIFFFFADGVGVSDLYFFFPRRSSGVEFFRVHGYSLQYSKASRKKQY